MAFPQPTFGYDLDRDVRTVSAMAERLVPYVYEEELYGLMPGNLPKLTLGGLLMRLQRLAVIKDLLSSSQQQTVSNAKAQLDATRKEWLVHFETKLGREIKARILTIEQFLNDCTDNNRACADNYASTMEKRVMIDVIAEEARLLNVMPTGYEERLVALDNAIRRFTEASDFRWDTRLIPAYPADHYWYLYCIVPKK